MYMAFSQQRADGLFGVFLINDHADICDNDTNDLTHYSL